ncbi:MAG: hypothetical protein HQ534_12585 [Armatimonadetes bacterium]|nr:hypothetical protein [Armatimonadota bacterium]
MKNMNENKEFYKIPSFLKTIFKDEVELLPSVNESFELAFILNGSKYISDLGIVNILQNDTATKMSLENNSIDGVITSPPYSFAIDYVKNDEAQLNFLGYDVNDLRGKMIGLVSKDKNERLENYFRDMKSVCSEVSRIIVIVALIFAVVNIQKVKYYA